MFDWLSFLNRRGIDYTTSGAREALIHCPFCGTADQGRHMSVSTVGRGFKCFRSPKAHSGRSPVRLIQGLLKCSWDEAFAIAGIKLARDMIAEHDFKAHITSLMSGNNNPEKPGSHGTLGMLSEMRRVADTGSGRAFAKYLVEKRKYEYRDINQLAKYYDLHYAMTGPFKYRLIFPIRMFGQLVNWTGRSIAETATLRYRTLSTNAEKSADSNMPVAAASIESTLWNYDDLLEGGDTLLTSEGPFDAMRFDYFGREFGVRATCFYTKSISDPQVALLSEIADKFKHRILVLDPDARLGLLSVQRQVLHLGFEVRQIPSRWEDPADMPRNAVLDFIGA